MALNYLGLVAAVTAFLSIWVGHVAVRKIESASRTIWLPIALAATAGLLLEILSLVIPNIMMKTALGIVGITLLWDAFEFSRQENRVRHGHAPANRHNPRHARILAEHPSATTLDLLSREPIGRPVSRADDIQLIEGS